MAGGALSFYDADLEQRVERLEIKVLRVEGVRLAKAQLPDVQAEILAATAGNACVVLLIASASITLEAESKPG